MMCSRPFTLDLRRWSFSPLALLHVYRIFTHFQVVLGSHTIPLWFSYFGAVIPALLRCILLLRESKAA